MSHTKEPWEIFWIGSPAGLSARIHSEKRDICHIKMEWNAEEDARRIVSCVNACANISIEDLEAGCVQKLVEAARVLCAQIFHNIPFDNEAMDGKLEALESALKPFEKL